MIDKLPEAWEPMVKVLWDNWVSASMYPDKTNLECISEALLAFLNAALEAGVAKEGHGWDLQRANGWSAQTDGRLNFETFPVIIMNMGDVK